MSRFAWAAAWSLWVTVAGLVLWGTADAPNRGEVGLLVRGSRVGAIDPGTAAARAHLQPGDPIGLEPKQDASTLRARLSRLRPGERLTLRVGSEPPRTVHLIAERPSGQTVAWRLAWGIVAQGFLLIALIVGRARRDRLGLVFLLWCTVTALAVSTRPIWPNDAASSAHDALSASAALFIPALLLHFFALFPEGRGHRRTALAMGLYAAATLLAISGPFLTPKIPMLSDFLSAGAALVFAVGLIAAIVSFVVSYRFSSVRHRRRLNVLLWCSVLGFVPVIAITLYSNLAPAPGIFPLPGLALLLLLFPGGIAYAIEVHQVFDFHWRSGKHGRARRTAIPETPPVFTAGDARATVDAVASDLHTRLGLSHCAVYWAQGNGQARLATWLGDVPEDGVPQMINGQVLKTIERLNRPLNLEELSAASTAGSTQTAVANLEKTGVRALIPLFSSGELRAVVALGTRLSEDLRSAERRASLREYAEHASLAVEHAEFHDDRVQQAKVERELELARGIQERLLPSRDPSFPTLECAGASIPSGHVGGDYYDYVELGPRRFGVVVGDVCGKGVPAALLVSHVQAALRLRALAGASPGEVLSGINRDLARFHQPEKFVCLAYAVVDARQRTIQWANGGLNPPLLTRPGGEVELLPTGDLILGVDPDTGYEESSLRLAPGESFVLITDGILDARRGDEHFGASELVGCLGRWSHLRARCLRDRLLSDAQSYHQTGLPDDMTVLVVRGC